MMSKQAQMKCRACKNHGIEVPLRGHKYDCPYRECSCFDCKTLQMSKAGARRSRANGTRTVTSYGCQPDDCEILQQSQENRANDVESTGNQKVVAWINGEELQDKSAEAHTSGEKVQSEDERQFRQTAQLQKPSTKPRENEATPAVSRTQILKQIKELHDLKECGALSTKEFEDAKAVVLRDFK